MGTLVSITPEVAIPSPGELVRAGDDLGQEIEIQGVDRNGGVRYTGLAASVRVRHLGGVSQTLDCTVSGTDVTIQLGTDGGGAVTSTAAQVVTKIGTVGAALLLLTPVATGSGAGVAAVTVGWVKLDGGALGSIRPALEFLCKYAGGWQPPAAFFRSDTAKVKISGLRALDLIGQGTELEVTLSIGALADGWYYVYASDDGTSSIQFEIASGGPDAYLLHKAGDLTKRFIGPVYVASHVLIPFHQTRSYYHFMSPFPEWNTLSATSFATKALVGVPPHVKVADLFVTLINAETVPNRADFRQTSTTASVYEGIYSGEKGTNAHTASGRVRVGVAGQQVDYQILSNASMGSSVDFYTAGWPL